MHIMFTSKLIQTPLGTLFAVADDHALYVLQFTDQPQPQRVLDRLTRTYDARIAEGSSALLAKLEEELAAYLAGRLQQFSIPCALWGPQFHMAAWQKLKEVPYAHTISYTQLAYALQNPRACRAAAQANAHNPFIIVVPCHRVIRHDGSLGGYNAGLERKKWLLAHERQHQN
jgi:AraC family transcriptional regulator of adaptative response/methylated-DNA-[protein]-cysteine methyltransferase